MDQILSTAFNGLFLYLGLALAFMVLAGVLRSPRFKGWAGEQRVQRLIRQRLNPLIYVDLHNVTLPTADGGSTQIDHLIFSPYGLFVLETKNFQGWIFGTEKQREWTQQIFKKRSKFQNPLRQNYKHIKTLQSLLGMESGADARVAGQARRGKAAARPRNRQAACGPCEATAIRQAGAPHPGETGAGCADRARQAGAS